MKHKIEFWRITSVKKIRALVVAPYAGLRETVNAISAMYRDVMDITVVLGNLEIGAQQAQSAAAEGYDVIISRGGTAELIGKKVDLPVVNIGISGYDYMRSIRMAENISGRKALVGFSYITEDANIVKALLQTDVEINTVRSLAEIKPLLTRLTTHGCELVIGDVATCRTADELGIRSLLLQSGEESVRGALDSAIKIVHSYSGKLEQLELLKRVISMSREQVVVLDRNGAVHYSSVDPAKFALSPGDLEQMFENREAGSDREVVLPRQSGTLLIRCSCMGNGLRAFYLRWIQDERRQQSKGVTVTNFKAKPAVNDFLRKNSIYDKKTCQIAQYFCTSRSNVLITGDFGVGKADMAAAIHRNSDCWQRPLIQIDFGAAKVQPSMNWLKNCAADMAQGGTLCLDNVDLLDKKGQAMVLETLCELPKKDWRFIATAAPCIRMMAREGGFDRELLQLFSELSLYIPNLRESHKDLERVVGLYIIEANARLGKQIAGVEPQGLEKIKQHTWMQNFSELNQAIYQMVLVTTGTFISEQTVQDTLESRTVDQTAGISLQGTLEEIELRIIRQVLEEENGVLSRTAERLNVGRSTLWRKLRDAGINA